MSMQAQIIRVAMPPEAAGPMTTSPPPLLPPDWPMFGVKHDLLPFLQDCLQRDQRVVLASLIWIQGSSPRPLGSEMAIAESGDMAGYVSGGCVEAAVALEAMAVFADGRPRLLDYGAGSPVLDLQLSCGGRIHLWLRLLHDPADYVETWQDTRQQRRIFQVDTDLTSGHMQWQSTSTVPAGARPGHFRQCHRPPIRLVAVGHDPVTLALLQLARQLEMETWLLRPDGPAAAPPFALDRYLPQPLQQAIGQIELDQDTAVYTLTHDGSVDHAVLSWALRSEAFCVGVLGARHKRDQRLQALLADGLPPDRLARLQAPAGLPLGGQSPMAIALAIVAEITQRWHQRAADVPAR